MNHPVLGNLSPDPFGEMLGTGYQRFQSPTGIDGLCKFTADRLDLLAVISNKEGIGQFRAFMLEAKYHFKSIYVWEIWNPRLALILAKYGFSPTGGRDTEGQRITGRVWTKLEKVT